MFKLKRRYYGAWCIGFRKLKKFDPAKVILIFSDPRGGSTWLTELIASIEKTAVVWEPLHPGAGNRFRQLNFDARQYIPKETDWEEAKDAFRNLFSGKMLSFNSFVLSSPLDFLFAKQLVVKFCRANAMLPWITSHFDFRFTPVYLVRHPFAVVASQLRHGSWDFKAGAFNISGFPFNEFYGEHREFLNTLKTKEEQLVAVWCLTNNVPLKNNRNNIDWIIIYYEDLIRRPEEELNHIFGRWKIEMPEGILKKVREKSLTTREDQFEMDVDEQLNKWTKFFNKEQIDKMKHVLIYFKVEVYSADSINPIKKFQNGPV